MLKRCRAGAFTHSRTICLVKVQLENEQQRLQSARCQVGLKVRPRSYRNHKDSAVSNRTEAISECEAWKQQAMPEHSMGVTGTELVTASDISEEAIASKDGSEQGMKQLEQFLSAPR